MQSTFKPINVESDDESDIEVDDTKEIQIEDALKLYQVALKCHSDGPCSYTQAQEAYDALFNSDIFSYPESYSYLKRVELYGPLLEPEELLLEEQEDVPVEGPVVTTENAPSTLPQILHLSHKNYGDFLLKALASQIGSNQNVNAGAALLEATSIACTALEHFVDALDKDETDLDLWSNTFSLAQSLQSSRTARFCLEAILDADEDVLLTLVELPGLAQCVAGQTICRLVASLDDTLSLSQTPLTHIKQKRLSKLVSRTSTVEDFAFLRQHRLRSQQTLGELTKDACPQPHVVPAALDWTDFACRITSRVIDEQSDGTSVASQRGVFFNLESKQDTSLAPCLVEIASPTETNDQAWAEHQFPGLDGGIPTVVNPAADLELLSEFSAARIPDKSDSDAAPAYSTRKRSSDAAGLLDSLDTSRLKSKRIRARESLADSSLLNGATTPKTSSVSEQALEFFDATDAWVFDTMDVFLRTINTTPFDIGPSFRAQLIDSPLSPKSDHPSMLPCADLYHAMCDFSRGIIKGLSARSNSSTYTSLLEGGLSSSMLDHCPPAEAPSLPSLDNQGLLEYVQAINTQWLRASDVALDWMIMMLQPKSSLTPDSHLSTESKYMAYNWSADLKQAILSLLTTIDGDIYRLVKRMTQSWGSNLLPHNHDDIFAEAELVQTFYELYLDAYSATKVSWSDDAVLKEHQSGCLNRWADLAQYAMQARLRPKDTDFGSDDLDLRFLWASMCFVTLSEGVDREHLVACLRDLRGAFVASGSPIISLPNNFLMPSLSVQVIDTEISKLTTAEFFRSIFQDQNRDSVSVIEQLEPLLEDLHQDTLEILGASASPVTAEEAERGQESFEHEFQPQSAENIELLKILRQSDVEIHLALWRRLTDAYNKIDFHVMATNCHLRVLEVVVARLRSTTYKEADLSTRQTLLYLAMNRANDVLSDILAIAKKHDCSFGALDEQRIRSATTALVQVLKITHANDVFEDEIRAEKRIEPSDATGGMRSSFKPVVDFMHNLELRSWIVLLQILKEAVAQGKEVFMTPGDSMMELIRSVHRAVGMRKFCNGSNRILLHFIKKELVVLKNIDGYELELSQTLFDMHGLECFVNPAYEKLDHQCNSRMLLDRGTAMEAAELLLRQSAKIKPADLYKHAIKDAIDTVHSVVSRKKPTSAVLFNRRIVSDLLASAINPLDMFKCLSGQGQTNMRPVAATDNPLTVTGWYLLLGNVCMSKFAAQKKTAAGSSSDDLESAIAYFKQDLEIGVDKWETWYQLAQAMDAKIEDTIMWSAEKLSGQGRTEIVEMERAALQSYRMAVAQATRLEDCDFETSAKVASLYAHFGSRLYASTRPPFSMQAFSMQDFERYFCRDDIEKGTKCPEMSKYTAWKITRALLRRAIAGNPEKWTLHYMLGKCLWKMYTTGDELSRHDQRPGHESALEAFGRAIDLIPRDKEKKDSKKDPILEPHYKIIAIVHKLVQRGVVHLKEAREILNAATVFARRADEKTKDAPWNEYVLAAVRSVQHADKSHWHHRFMARAARIVYDDDDGGDDGAMRVRDEMMQHMFTRTMTLQVWRPERERPGRHFVYTSIYTRFFVNILEQLDDAGNLEQLAKRVRRKANDYLDHTNVWIDLASAYLRVLRRQGRIALAFEMTVFGTMEHELFRSRKQHLEDWCQVTSNDHPALTVIRDAIDFKKINANLMKPGTIDDLIGDAYAHLFNTIGRDLWEAAEREEKRLAAERAQQQQVAETKSVMSVTALMNLDGAGASEPPASSVEVETTGGDDDIVQTDGAAVGKRKVGIGRREIRASAEACLRPVASQAPKLDKETPIESRIQVVLPSKRRARSSSSISVSSRSGINLLLTSSDDSDLSEIDEAVVNEGKRLVEASEGRDIASSPRSFIETVNESSKTPRDDEQLHIDNDISMDDALDEEDDDANAEHTCEPISVDTALTEVKREGPTGEETAAVTTPMTLD